MPARLDHLVIAVTDLAQASRRWTDAGFPASAGGAHPVGTANALVRGPEPAYVELIAAGSDESNPWLDRVRSGRGPISWAIAVDDVDAARAALVDAGFDPRPVTEGSRRTPEGVVVAWRMCDVGPGPYDADLPFLIQWTEPMAPGPAEGPVLAQVTLAPRDPDRVADLLLVLGFVGNAHWPRRVFHEPGRHPARITLLPLGDPVERKGTWTMSWPAPEPVPEWSVTMSVAREVPREEMGEVLLDGVGVTAVGDRRRIAASRLLPEVDRALARLRGDIEDWPHPRPGQPASHAEYSRVTAPARYALVGARADAWVEAVTTSGLGVTEEVDPEHVSWRAEPVVRPTRVTRLRGPRPGTQPVLVGWAPLDGVPDAVVVVGSGEPTELLQLQPDCACDACDTGSADLLEAVDAAFLLALSGGVHSVREGDRTVARTLDGWRADGAFARDEPERWLRDAEQGRRTEGVLRGEPWL